MFTRMKVTLLLLGIVIWTTAVKGEVSLSLPINIGHAKPGSHLIFTCETRGSRVRLVEWTSDEYIGRNGEHVTLTTANNFRSPNTYTNASIIDSSTDGGETVLVSQLEIIVQPSLPESSVTCRNAITNEAQTANFRSLNNPDLVVSSRSVCPGDIRTFVCEMWGSNIVSWMGTTYTTEAIIINVTDAQDSSIMGRGGTTARLITSTVVNGIRVIFSEFNITVTPDILRDRRHYITCVNYNLQTEGIIAIQVKDNCGGTIAPSLLTPVIPVTLNQTYFSASPTMVTSSECNCDQTTKGSDLGGTNENTAITACCVGCGFCMIGLLIAVVIAIVLAVDRYYMYRGFDNDCKVSVDTTSK